MQYAFILGHNPKLSIAEISAIFPNAEIVEKGKGFLILDNIEIDCQKTLDKLGGTIKIAEVIGEEISEQVIADELLKEKPDGKLKFGLSFYGRGTKPKSSLKLGLEVKKILRGEKVSCRLVTSKEPVLSSVVVTKNKCQEFIILNNEWLAKTMAVQEFEGYSTKKPPER